MGSQNTVEFAHIRLHLIPKLLNFVDMRFVVFKAFGMIDPEVM